MLEVRVVAPKETSVFLDRRMEFQLSPAPCERCGASMPRSQCAACGHRRN